MLKIFSFLGRESFISLETTTIVVKIAKENIAAPSILTFVGSGLADIFFFISLAEGWPAKAVLLMPCAPRIRADEVIIAHNQMAFILFMYCYFLAFVFLLEYERAFSVVEL